MRNGWPRGPLGRDPAGGGFRLDRGEVTTLLGSVRRLAGAAVVAAACASVRAELVLTPLATGLNYPVAVVSARDGTGRLFLVELPGRIRILDPRRGLLDQPFLDITDRVSLGGERGMWSLAFAPDFRQSGTFFVGFSDLDGRLVLARYRVSPSDPDRADPASEERLINEPHPEISHYAGQVQFGPDGDLYFSTGDGGGAGDPQHHAQDLSSVFGKILRLNPNAAPGGQLAAAGNPFGPGDSARRPEIWDYGFRNPWRFSFDRATGDLYVGDVGQDCWEEVDREPAGSPGGMDYGWPIREGPTCYEWDICSRSQGCPSFTSPILTYPHTEGCAVTGGLVYRGTRIPFLEGAYLYSDWCSGRIWMAEPAGETWTRETLLSTSDPVTGFGEDEDGGILVVAGSGQLWRIDPPAYPLFSDDFSDGDASDWATESGRWTVASEGLETASHHADIAAPFPGCAECTLRARIRVPSGNGESSLIGWRSGPHTFTELRVTGNPSALLLRRVEHGRAVVRAGTLLLPEVPAGEFLDVGVTWTGTRYEVTLGANDDPVLVLPAPAPASGTIGFRVRGGRDAPSAFGALAVR